jgi:hypothetical protein
LKSVDKKAKLARIEFTQSVIPERSRKIMDETLRQVANRAGRRLGNENELRNTTIEESAVVLVDAASGWLESLTQTRTVKSGRSAETKTMKITRKR